jgi:hypothetical protein
LDYTFFFQSFPNEITFGRGPTWKFLAQKNDFVKQFRKKVMERKLRVATSSNAGWSDIIGRKLFLNKSTSVYLKHKVL